MDSKVFGQFIARTRKEKHMTQADLAQLVGVTDKAVSRWERGIGFPDITLLESLAAALDISILELMRSERSVMEKQDDRLSESEVTEMMKNAVEMARENQRQDRFSLWLAGAAILVVAVLTTSSGHTSVGGGILVGAFAALAVVGMYLFSRNREDRDSRRIYSAFMLGGISGFLMFLHLMGVDPNMIGWGIYGFLCLFIVLSNR